MSEQTQTQKIIITLGYAGLGVLCELISERIPLPPTGRLCIGLILCVIAGLCTIPFEINDRN